jgi:hypothetical protein
MSSFIMSKPRLVTVNDRSFSFAAPRIWNRLPLSALQWVASFQLATWEAFE